MNNQLPTRKTIRIPDYDYSLSHYYFITLCTHNRELYFDQYPELAKIVESEWKNISNRYFNVYLDQFVIMPNHLHGIICIDYQLNSISLGAIVGSFKSISTNIWLKNIKEKNIQAPGKFWQRNFYEHVIRNEKDLARIREYIMLNPLQWDLDEYNPKRKHKNLDPIIEI